MYPVFSSVQVFNKTLESAGRAGKVVGNEQTHPVLSAEATALRPHALQVEHGTVAVELDGDIEATAFDLADVRML